MLLLSLILYFYVHGIHEEETLFAIKKNVLEALIPVLKLEEKMCEEILQGKREYMTCAMTMGFSFMHVQAISILAAPHSI